MCWSRRPGTSDRFCVEELPQRRHRVTVYDNSPRAIARRWMRARNSSKLALGRGCACEAMTVAKPEAVISLRRQRARGRVHDDPGKYFLHNVGNGTRLLDAAVKAGVKKFVFSSTCATYGTPRRCRWTNRSRSGRSILRQSKLMFERILQWYQQLHWARVCRLSYSTPPGQREVWEHHASRPTSFRSPQGRPRQKPHCEIFGTDSRRPTAPASAIHPHRGSGRAHILALQPGKQGLLSIWAWRRLFGPSGY